ncbi:uncharacterized protein RCO7_14617 [Rhynchosporium graminicola]|uniref:Uncharacterized protein n=1 Tax=Rhynchosporium graminicola TaxID=2792576 RepID=A0A1E1KRS8_9HELO|nr:uncharacterized protein RCO7_14617 [Rhynchosporium commune]
MTVTGPGFKSRLSPVTPCVFAAVVTERAIILTQNSYPEFTFNNRSDYIPTYIYSTFGSARLQSRYLLTSQFPGYSKAECGHIHVYHSLDLFVLLLMRYCNYIVQESNLT